MKYNVQELTRSNFNYLVIMHPCDFSNAMLMGVRLA